MRLVHVCRTAPPRVGGLEGAVFGLCRALALRGHEVRLVTLGEPGEELREGVRILRLRPLGPRRWPTALGLRAACQGADLVHAHALDGLLDALVLGGVRPIGVSTHGGYFHTDRDLAWKELWLRTGTRAVLSRVDRVWFSSEADRARLAPARARGTVEPDGVDVERFAALPRTPERGRWLVLGRLDVHKGLDDLLRALPALRDRCATLELVGPEDAPGLSARLLDQASRLGLGDRVRLRGALVGAALEACVSAAELALLPSRYEGFGVAALELMAARVPVVLSDIPAHRAHGDVAPVADFRRPDLAAAAIREALDRPRDPGPAARRAAEHAWPARALAWERRYQELVGGR